MGDAERVVEEIARTSYGRLVAYLSAQTRDPAGAEDALGDALLAALTEWPRDGVPAKPEAWLLSVARHRLIDRVRHDRVQAAAASTMRLIAERPDDSAEEIPDDRLQLLFVCAHPAIDLSLHTPLMLQLALGLDAARIAQAFLVSPSTMGQRLSRAKTKIRAAGIPFRVPDDKELGARLDAVLDAIYAAYGIAWDHAAGADPRSRGLADEAIWLARVLVQRLPGEPEARGLLALALYCESRRSARRSPEGRYVPLSEQDPARWDPGMIDEAERQLTEASRAKRPGRFQLQAAIQSVHAERRRNGRTDWPAIEVFYEHLVRVHPSVGAQVGHAAALSESRGPEAGLARLEALAEAQAYQPYWALRAHLLRQLGREGEAASAYDRAIGLAEDPAIRKFLLDRRG